MFPIRFRTALLAGAMALAWTIHAVAAEGQAPRGLRPVPVSQVTIQDEFWSPKRMTWQEVTIRDSFTKFENDRGGALNNFDKVSSGAGGKHAGPPWYDGLIYEMIRGSSDFLLAHPDPALDAQLDGYIARIAAAAAKDPNGYVNTWTQLEEPTHRWGLNGGNQRWQHEVYNAGALVEAAVHHYRATGKTSLLQVAVKFANTMYDFMGPRPKRNIVPAHSLPEEALTELYLLFRAEPGLKSRLSVPVDEANYLKLAEFWIEARGRHTGKPNWEEGDKKAEAYIRSAAYGDDRPTWGAYAQDHKPVLEQETIEGHAVRATLMCTGLAAAARVNGREDYRRAAERLWNNMALQKTHITGGTGAFAHDEKFGPNYVLPNDAYLETCAAVGAGFFHRNMNLLEGDAKYIDQLERVLYNGALSGVSVAGTTYFYENPLVAAKNRDRWVWHDCPCCPPMFLKIMGAMPGYVYAQDDDGVYVNLFVGNRARIKQGQTDVTLEQTTRYPWDGLVTIKVNPEKAAAFDMNVRLPGWCRRPVLKVNGVVVASPVMSRGYARVRRTWKKGDVITLSLPMPVERVKAHPLVQADVGRVALMRGPIVYCLESADNAAPVSDLMLPATARLVAEPRPELLGGVTVIKGQALEVNPEKWSSALYLFGRDIPAPRPVEFTAIPYFANTNRGPVEMLVWLREAVTQLASR
jgi:DUF1680 family protein